MSASAPALAPGLDRHSLAEAVGRLAGDPRKPDLYRDDVFFAEAIDELAEISEGMSPEWLVERLERHTFILLKPDVEASGREQHALDFLLGHGLEPIACYRFTFDRLVVRSLWQHNFIGDDVVRMRIIDALLTTAPTSAYLLRAREPLVTASSALSRLKGAADPSRRPDSTLRSHLDCPNVFLSGVHAPDDAADMIREFGLLLDRETRRGWLAGMVADVPLPAWSVGTAGSWIAPRPHDPRRSRGLVARALGEQMVADLLVNSGGEAAPHAALAAVDRLLQAACDDTELCWAAIIMLTDLFAGPLPIGSGIPPASAVRAEG